MIRNRPTRARKPATWRTPSSTARTRSCSSGETAAGKYPIEGRRHDGAHRDLYRGASAARQHPASPAGGCPQCDRSARWPTPYLIPAARWRATSTRTRSSPRATPARRRAWSPASARDCPIIAPTPSASMGNISWSGYGVVPAHMGVSGDTGRAHQYGRRSGAEVGLIKTGDACDHPSAGALTGVSGTTNLIKAHIVGNLSLLRGEGGQRLRKRQCLHRQHAQRSWRATSDGNVIVTKMTTSEMLPCAPRERRRRGKHQSGVPRGRGLPGDGIP